MKSFLKGLLYAAINAAAKGAGQAGDSGADIDTVGIAAGAGALAGALGFLLNHPAAAHPVVGASVTAALAGPVARTSSTV